MTRRIALVAGPLLLLGLLVVSFAVWRPLDRLSTGAPPREAIAFERVALDETGIHAYVRADGSEPVVIAQVLVDDAYWTFAMTPAGPLPRLTSARIDIPYPWVEGEAHKIKLITRTGQTFEHEIKQAVATPKGSGGDLIGLGLVGLFVGPVPVLIGLAFYPALRRIGAAAMTFLLGLTIGLLGFLLVDAVAEGLEAAGQALDGLKARALFWAVAASATLVLFAVGRRGGRPPEAMALAGFIAFGIGLHNLGEGLAIGAALATGEVALASFLVLGFAVHNVTEGIGIAAPLRDAHPTLLSFAWLAALAGGPAVLGAWGGAYAYAPHLAAVCFGIGAGAILQVMIELALYLQRRATEAVVTPVPGLSGAIAGLAVMYATSLLIAA
jgi:zinc transporter ZupT